MRYARLQHQFVDQIPERLEPGVLYVSMDYATSAHSCCCGCGEEVVAPFSPTDWKMTFDGETVSLRPSIGSWTLKCRSHYVIDRGRVIDAGPWSDERIAAERRRDHWAKAEFYGHAPVDTAAMPQPSPTPFGFWQRVWTRITGGS